MPDYTDPALLPFPTDEDYGDGSNYLEELARAVDPLIVAENARLAALALKPTCIRNRTTTQAYTSGNMVLDFNVIHHDNFSPVVSAVDGWTTPAAGVGVAGRYPAIWRFDLWVSVITTTVTVGDGRTLMLDLWQMSDALGREDVSRTWDALAVETNTGGEYLQLSGAAMLDRPGRFLPRYNAGGLSAGAGNIQAGSFMSLTRIRGI
jgi:hypothetical protein